MAKIGRLQVSEFFTYLYWAKVFAYDSIDNFLWHGICIRTGWRELPAFSKGAFSTGSITIIIGDRKPC